MNSTHRVLHRQGVLLLFLLCFVFFQHASAQVANWHPASVSLEAPVGTETSFPVELMSSKTLYNVYLSVVPELAPYVKVDPPFVSVLDENTPFAITIQADLRTVLVPIDLEGTVQLRSSAPRGSRVIARPLSVRLVGREPNETGLSISGYVTTAAGVNVTARGPQTLSTITDAAGVFSLKGLPPGQYTVSPNLPGSVFTPVHQAVTLVDRDITDLVFSPVVPEDALSKEIMTRIDSIPDSWLPRDEVILPNGINLRDYLEMRGIAPDNPELQSLEPSSEELDLRSTRTATASTLPPAEGPQQKKNDIIAKMLVEAESLACGRRAEPDTCTDWDTEAEGDSDGNTLADRPAQRGLTYIFGGKDHTVRTLPVDGCPERTYGLDCSGLVYQIATRAGISLPVGTSATQSNPASWRLPSQWQLEMKLVTDGAIESGDILGWSGHIGIAETGGAIVNVISATGRPGECSANINPPRGPRSLPLSEFGPPTAILRLVTTLSGTFDMPIRCAGQPTDAAVLRFEINNDKGGPFQATGTGTDYDGTPLCFTLAGDYDQASNEVSALLSLCDQSRKDSFSVRLLTDDTGYFPLRKVVDNGGCAGEARLIRLQGEGGVQASGDSSGTRTSGSAGIPRFGGAAR